MRSVTQGEDAVSPTIAAILLVVITIVLVLIAGAVVMDSGEQEDTKFVEIYMVPSGENAFLVTVMGGYDADTLVSLNGYINGVMFDNNGFIGNPKVGIPYLLKVFKSSADGGALFTLVGTFEDGTVQMLYQRMVTVRGSGVVPPWNLGKPNGLENGLIIGLSLEKGVNELIMIENSKLNKLYPEYFDYVGSITEGSHINIYTNSNNGQPYGGDRYVSVIFVSHQTGGTIGDGYRNLKLGSPNSLLSNDIKIPEGFNSGDWCYITISGYNTNTKQTDSVTAIIRMSSSA
ncbi:hypothetical protein [Methanorbis rubei]